MRCFPSLFFIAAISRGGAEGMKPHYAAALALVVWYLLHPPLPHLNPHASRVDPAAPLARWTIVKTFPTQKGCDAHRGANPWERCIASDDPRLKEK
jgi:hypothetical protein